jgi:positive regulator of sigma E activity
MSERSYSDREVSLVLRRAAEIEAAEGGSVGGASEAEVIAIAREAGISPEAVARAFDELHVEAGVTGTSFLPPSSRRSTLSIPGALGREQLAGLVQSIEDRIGRPGTVTEALDTVRWTSTSSMWTTQVSLSSGPGGSKVGVHERINDRSRRVLFILPGNLGLMIGMIVAGSIGASTAGMLSVAAAGGIAGLAIGRAAFKRFSRASRERVERLAADVAEAARRLLPGTSPE